MFALIVQDVSHRYGDRVALDGVELHVDVGCIFGLLGPNGSGKTTLFRVLSTLLPLQDGTIHVFESDLAVEPAAVRRLIGVTFQSPSLDRRLTVFENLLHQAHLYGLSGSRMRRRVDDVLAQLSLADRRRDRVDSLSGGLQRRVEIAKSLLHSPRLLILDEPSTGLDPTARIELWSVLRDLQAAGVSILLTTHLMDEAEKCDRLAILDQGTVVAAGEPHELRSSLGGDCLTIHALQPDLLAQKIAQRFDVVPQRLDESLLIERENGHEFLRDLVAEFTDDISAVSLGKPTLEDVFVARTGRRFESAEVSA